MTLEEMIGQFKAYTEYPNQDTFVISNAECKQILEYLMAYKNVADTNAVNIDEVIKTIHDTIYEFFNCVEDDSEEGISDKDELLLSVNKAICNKLREKHKNEY